MYKRSTQIIYLNGPTSSGKTSLAKKLQEVLHSPFMLIGIDKMISMMPQHLNDWDGGAAPLGFSWKASTDAEGHPIQTIQMGPIARLVTESMKDIVLAMARRGLHIIVDDVENESGLFRWKEHLKDYNVLYVGLTTPLTLLEQREQARGNRMIGSARDQHGWSPGCSTHYDLFFDTSSTSIDELAKIVAEAVQN